MKALTIFTIAMLLSLASASTASAAPTTVLLHEADPFAIMAGSTITDVPTSPIGGDVGLSPAAGSVYAGLTCAEVTGTVYAVDATGLPCYVPNAGMLTLATTAVTNAYLDAFARTPDDTSVLADNQLGGRTLVPGVYRFPAATTANLSGNLTLSGNADAVWIFQATSTLVTAASSTVTLVGGAQACNVFWQVGSSATLHAGSTLVGTILANANIDVDSSVTVQGRLLAGAMASGWVTLINDTIAKPSTCVTQSSIDSAAAAAAQAAAAAAAAAAAQAAAVVQAAADAKLAADQAAAAVLAAQTAATAAATAAAAAAAKVAADTNAAAAKAGFLAAKATKVAATEKAAAAKRKAALAKKLRLKLTSIRIARTHAGFTG